jgi:hypothetical protein
MSLSIKSATERQELIKSKETLINHSITNSQTDMMIKHFENILKNWANPPEQILGHTPGKIEKEISIPIITEINKSKYDEWTKIFTNAGYIVKQDQYRFTVSMP